MEEGPWLERSETARVVPDSSPTPTHDEAPSPMIGKTLAHCEVREDGRFVEFLEHYEVIPRGT